MGKVVLTIRYAGAREISAMTAHETDRRPDGASAIDPTRSALNKVLHGPRTQAEAVQQLLASGVRGPTAQADRAYVQMVLSASPEYFRGPGQGPGEWDQAKLDAWRAATMTWLKGEYGADLVHVSLHLDEDTPHVHVLVVPTYERKPRKPALRKKSGETPEQLAERVAAWEAAPAVRTVGRSSSEYWSRKWCRREARKSYTAAVEPLGLEYGHDYVGEGLKGPMPTSTAQHVRKKAAAVEAERAEIERKAAALATAAQAIAEDVKNGTIGRSADGKIRVSNPKIITPALPAIKPMLNAAADFGGWMRSARAQIDATRRAAEKDRAEAAADKVEAQGLLNKMKGLIKSTMQALGDTVRLRRLVKNKVDREAIQFEIQKLKDRSDASESEASEAALRLLFTRKKDGQRADEDPAPPEI